MFPWQPKVVRLQRSTEEQKIFIVENRLGAERTNRFRLRSGTLIQHFYTVCPSYERFDVAYICTHPPQCVNLHFFSACSVR